MEVEFMVVNFFLSQAVENNRISIISNRKGKKSIITINSTIGGSRNFGEGVQKILLPLEITTKYTHKFI